MLLRATAVVGLLVLVLSQVDVRQVVDSFATLNAWYVIPYVILYAVSVGVSTWRWRLFLRALAIPLGYWTALRLYFIGVFFSNALPTSVGGDAYKYVVIRRRTGSPRSQIASTLILERGFGLIALLTAGAASGIVLALTSMPVAWLAVTSGLYVVASAGSLAVLAAVRRRQQPESTGRIAGAFRQVQHAIASVRSRSVLWKAYVASAVFVGLNACCLYFSLRMFGETLSISTLFFFVAVLNTVALLPITFNGLGLQEAIGVPLLATFGIASATGLAILLLTRALLLLLSCAGGFLYVAPSGRSRALQAASSREIDTP